MNSYRKISFYLKRRSNKLFAGVFGLMILTLSSCYDDNLGNNYFTFTGETIGEYITTRPDEFSEFSKILDTTSVKGLLNAYGMYTCFLPDNEAMYTYYQSKGKSSIEQFPMDSLKKIAHDHIIQNFEIPTTDFGIGFLSKLTMSGRYLKTQVETTSGGFYYLVNSESKIISKDIELHNGIVHVLDKVLNPTESTVVEAISEDENFKLFSEALVATGLAGELGLIKDDSYVLPSDLEVRENTAGGNGSINRVPFERKYGFTILAESDQVLAENSIFDLEDMKAKAKEIYDPVFPEDAGITDITDRKNSLNRFIAYHLLDKKIPRLFFIEKFDKTGENYSVDGGTHSVQAYDMYEYIETMCPNTLLEVRTDRTNVLDPYDIFNRVADGSEVKLTDNYDNDALNGVYHEIDNILAYSVEVKQMLSTKRLRMDAASFFPEFANNNIRVGQARDDYPYESWRFPTGYIERVSVAPGTSFGYLTSDDRFLDYQGDEVFLGGEQGETMYDFEVTTLPIPAGTYEVRFGWQPTGNRGVVQLYWDGKPCGIPLDLTITATNPKIGYEKPGSNYSDPDGFENDKMMRNRGYMKGPGSFKLVRDAWGYGGPIARDSERALRRILGIYTFDKDTTHVLRAKAAKAGEFMFDYLEFVPVEVLESEDVL
ncbi:fasciclin domain-containing protein [Carboxylicivirga caseinilyticus]|uniref:fasciclin domain-containing protein n=1 Tax=Carboxylicivirga caseinilyticus TaxID=3417572 RepID=UPI003D342A4D|nr:fasciclin domain-containing protein [Marinilabiliaceae bacterium A049]